MANEPPSESVYELVAAAAAVIRRWDADNVNAGLMDQDIERLRDAMREAGRGLTIRSDYVHHPAWDVP